MIIIKPRFIFLILSILFIAYSLTIYTYSAKKNDVMSSKAVNGKMVWQKYNCQACHQIYGLGGYLGPDLTNLTSNASKNKNYIEAMLKSGPKQMPKLNLKDQEIEQLVEFLKAVNTSGSGNQYILETDNYGMIKHVNE